ncbi:hypothetical protein SPRG_03899 [Saprolegnia parasitica CBS 223.65]|uniref:Peptidase C51 domain-containing protein n=1 Tax=Saprolegnia parasitica (strain CBS 223.65) TaxID=695850 RepID=A0A067CKP8_SAPPC|nr:hypothetical protein SPRG_03899 [Saprolegnia parasitica CBS 223.65]KDO31284.1 hypothetical protein SPRG_03899 [Saprolegnia parasitica CBS 223.65]|eukprot:XP_012197883.1 hypothetical protein SPRG_03899 [Saprolegnia parasitica CBS 223.65]
MAATTTHQRRWPGDNPNGEKAPVTGMRHGALLGTCMGVEGYNCNYKNNPDADLPHYDGSNFLDGLCTGMKWQCVEYARRFWVLKKGIVLPSLSWAAHIWTKIEHVSRRDDFAIVPLQKLPNFGTEKPEVGDFLVYQSTPNQWVGHVAVVVGVFERDGRWVVRVAEQNVENNKLWPGDYADELELQTDVVDGKTTYGIVHRDTDLVLDGWVRARLDQARARAPWTRPAPRVAVSGIYDHDSAVALQTFVGSYPDGSHGGMTNTDIRNVLRQYGTADEAPTTTENDELVMCLRKFLLGRPTLLAPFKAQALSCPGTGRCVCRTIRREPLDDADAATSCSTTSALQAFLNSVHHPHDLRSALAQLASQTS